MTRKELKVKIFVAHHKPGYIYEDDVYVPIQVGKKNAKVDLGILGDDTGDNISEKNDNYAELTAQYWVWKNYDLSDVDYVGFCHYRRYLSFFEKHTLKDVFLPKNMKRSYDEPNSFWNVLKFEIGSILFLGHNSLLRKWDVELIKKESRFIAENINKKKVDIYLPKSMPLGNFKYPPFEDFGIKNKDLSNVIIDTFLDLFPQYERGLKRTQKQYLFHKCNIFIMDKKSFYEYCRWLFTYFLELEKRISKFDTSGELIGERFLGTFGEFMVDFWLNCVKGEKTTLEKNQIRFKI